MRPHKFRGAISPASDFRGDPQHVRTAPTNKANTPQDYWDSLTPTVDSFVFTNEPSNFYINIYRAS